MLIGSIRLVLLLALAGVSLSACEKPYIYDPQEYNREQANYGRDLKDRTELKICYLTRNTTPQDILAMAEAECGKFNKSARYLNSQVGECPIGTPTLASFVCERR